MVKENKRSLAFLRRSKLLHAETTAAAARIALFEIASWEYVEFAYDRSARPPVETMAMPWDEVLTEAVTRHKEQETRSRQTA